MPLDPYFNLRPNRGNAPSRKADLLSTVTKVDPGQAASLLSAIVEVVDGRDLRTILPWFVGLLSDRLGISPTGDFQDALSTPLYTLVGPDGRTVTLHRSNANPTSGH